MRTMRWACAAALLIAAAGLAGAGTPEDDLAVVKKAVASPSPAARKAAPAQSAAAPRAQAAEPDRPAPPARTGAAPQWFKVRVVEKGGKSGRVTINLPLSVVRALGDDWPMEFACGGRHASGHEHECPKIKLSEVLRTLDTGQPLVEIDDDDATVRVWVE